MYRFNTQVSEVPSHIWLEAGQPDGLHSNKPIGKDDRFDWLNEPFGPSTSNPGKYVH